MFSSISPSSSIAFIATVAHPLYTPTAIGYRPPASFSFTHHAQHISPFVTSQRPAISPLLFAPSLMQQPTTKPPARLTSHLAMVNPINEDSEFESTWFPFELTDLSSEFTSLSSESTSLSAEAASFGALVQKLPNDITFCHKNEISGLLLPEHAIRQEKSEETQRFLDQFTPEEKALLKEKLMQINPKLNHWTAHQNAYLLVKKEVSKEKLGDYLSQQFGTFITPDEIHLFLQSCLEKNQTSPEGFLLDLTPLMKQTAKQFLNETLLNDQHLKNLQQLATTDTSMDQLFGNFFSFINAPKKSTVFKAAGLIAALKADDTLYWMQQKVAVSQNKLPRWIANSEFLATEKINFEENILKAFREQDPLATVDIIKQRIIS